VEEEKEGEMQRGVHMPQKPYLELGLSIHLGNSNPPAAVGYQFIDKLQFILNV
jgi:hypothetical protein